MRKRYCWVAAGLLLLCSPAYSASSRDKVIDKLLELKSTFATLQSEIAELSSVVSKQKQLLASLEQSLRREKEQSEILRQQIESLQGALSESQSSLHQAQTSLTSLSRSWRLRTISVGVIAAVASIAAGFVAGLLLAR